MTKFTTIKNGIKFHIIGIMAIIVIAVIGLKVAENYGMAWDEYVMRDMGYMDYNYITQKGDYKPNPFYGPIIELPLVILEVKLGITDYKSIFVMRHIACHLLFLLGALALYFAVYLLLKRRLYALLALLFYFTFPTLYAHSFFNSKDTPFLSFYSMLFLAFIITLKYPKWLSFVILGLFIGFVMNSRIIGVSAIPAIGLSMLVAIFVNPTKFKPIRTAIQFSASILISFLVLYFSWPLLWDNPIQNFLKILFQSSHYTFVGSDNLFNGHLLNSNNLPFWYLPAWMSITIPLLVQGLFLIGLVSTIAGFVKFKDRNTDITIQLFQLTLAMSFLIPLLAVMIMHSPLFDSWRHMYFLYLMVLYFAVLGFRFIYENTSTIIKYFSMVLVGLHSCLAIIFMIESHPFQNLYFNELISKKPENIRTHYDFDYWGTSFRKGLEFILQDTNADSIRILAANSPGRFNQFILSPEQRNRLVFVKDLKNADYFMGNYRFHPQEYPFSNNVFRIKIKGSSVLTVWKIEDIDRKYQLKIDN